MSTFRRRTGGRICRSPRWSRILGASSDGDQDWGLPRVKYAIGECNPTLCMPKAGLVIMWSDRRERSEENPGAYKKTNLLILIRRYCWHCANLVVDCPGRNDKSTKHLVIVSGRLVGLCKCEDQDDISSVLKWIRGSKNKYMHKIFYFYEFFLIENTKYCFANNLTWGRLVFIMTWGEYRKQNVCISLHSHSI